MSGRAFSLRAPSEAVRAALDRWLRRDDRQWTLDKERAFVAGYKAGIRRKSRRSVRRG